MRSREVQLESESRSYEMRVRNANGANLSLSFNVIASLPGICTYNDEKAIRYMADMQKRKQSLVYPMLCILDIFFFKDKTGKIKIKRATGSAQELPSKKSIRTNKK